MTERQYLSTLFLVVAILFGGSPARGRVWKHNSLSTYDFKGPEVRMSHPRFLFRWFYLGRYSASQDSSQTLAIRSCPPNEVAQGFYLQD